MSETITVATVECELSINEAPLNLCAEFAFWPGYDATLYPSDHAEPENYDAYELLAVSYKEGSELIVYGDVEKVESAFGKQVEGNKVYLDGVMSRKKEIVPELERVF